MKVHSTSLTPSLIDESHGFKCRSSGVVRTHFAVDRLKLYSGLNQTRLRSAWPA